MSNMRFDPPDELLANHDVLIIGYRGVDGTKEVQMIEVSLQNRSLRVLPQTR